MMTPEEYTKDQMKQIGRLVDNEIPVGYGFLVLVFPFGGPDEGRANYVSNANRSDIKKVMAEFIDGTRPGWGEHLG